MGHALPKAPQPTEHQIQSAYFDLVRANRPRVPELNLVRAFPNGGLRHRGVAGQLKAEGVEAGPPDVIVPLPRGGYCGLWFEFKRPGKKPKGEQAAYMTRLEAAGWRIDVQFNPEIAFHMTLCYLKGQLRLEAPMK